MSEFPSDSRPHGRLRTFGAVALALGLVWGAMREELPQRVASAGCDFAGACDQEPVVAEIPGHYSPSVTHVTFPSEDFPYTGVVMEAGVEAVYGKADTPSPDNATDVLLSHATVKLTIDAEYSEGFCTAFKALDDAGKPELITANHCDVQGTQRYVVATTAENENGELTRTDLFAIFPKDTEQLIGDTMALHPKKSQVFDAMPSLNISKVNPAPNSELHMRGYGLSTAGNLQRAYDQMYVGTISADKLRALYPGGAFLDGEFGILVSTGNESGHTGKPEGGYSGAAVVDDQDAVYGTVSFITKSNTDFDHYVKSTYGKDVSEYTNIYFFALLTPQS